MGFVALPLSGAHRSSHALRAKHDRHCCGHAPAAEQSLRAAGPRTEGGQGDRWAGEGFCGAAGQIAAALVEGLAAEPHTACVTSARPSTSTALFIRLSDSSNVPPGSSARDREGSSRLRTGSGCSARSPLRGPSRGSGRERLIFEFFDGEEIADGGRDCPPPGGVSVADNRSSSRWITAPQ